MRINTNMAALNAWRNMTTNEGNVQKSLEKLSSGFRINRAADDAAGLAVSEKMRAQIRGTNMAVRNSQDGISLVQTAEGALTETHSILQRMRELGVQASTSTLSSEDANQVQTEFDQLRQEIDRISTNTKFNTKTLIDGSSGVAATIGDATKIGNVLGTGDTKATGSALNLTVATATKAEALINVGAATLSNPSDLTVNGVKFSFAGTETLAQIRDAINAKKDVTGVDVAVNGTKLELTSVETGSNAKIELTGTADLTGNMSTDLGTPGTSDGVLATGQNATVTGLASSDTYEAIGNRITITSGDQKGLSFDVLAAGTSTLGVNKNGSLKFQVGSEEGQQMSVSIGDMSASGLGLTGLSVTDQTKAGQAVTALDKAIEKVSTQRASLGAAQNRLEHTVASLQVTSENLSSAESRIRDVDMASEMANFTKNNILMQASQAMLAQANQSTQGILSLLR